MSSATSFTGRKRQRQTRWTVHVADCAARWIIGAGGIGTIVAVLLVCVFLVWVVVPLFAPASLELSHPLKAEWIAEKQLNVAIDEHQLLGRAVLADGRLVVFRADTGEALATREFLAATSPSAAAFSVDGQKAAFGFADGSVRLARLSFTTDFVTPAHLPEALQKLKIGETASDGSRLLVRTSADQFRAHGLTDEIDAEPLIGAGKSGVARIDLSDGPKGQKLCVLTHDGQLSLHAVNRHENLLSDEIVSEVSSTALPFELSADRKLPQFVMLSGLGDNVYLAWSDGHLVRYDTSNPDHPRVAQEMSITGTPGEKLTALTFMLGRTTLVAGYSTGTIRGWFRTKPDGAETSDGALLKEAHTLPGTTSPVTSLAPSARTRMLAAGYENGALRVYYLTNDHLMVEQTVPDGAAIEHVTMAPRDNGLVVASARGLSRWKLNPEHPEVTMRALFLPLWYEGYEQPEWVWQSSSGSDEFEPKLGLTPLIFGTLKATFYSMLFGVPLALCAAVYTSEFLPPKAKARIKPGIEMMASLPSVVLGFLAALVIAPFVEDIVPTLITGIFAVPFVFLLAAYTWQLMPSPWTVRWAPWRFLFICATLPLGILLAFVLGPLVERWLFAGNLRTWLDGRGSGAGGWLVILLPLCGVAVAWLVTQQVNPWLRSASASWSRTRRAALDLVKFVVGSVATVAIAWLLASLLTASGFDPRGSLLGTYVQRNALIVGFVMGFAIVPIIYTIADDALSTVPEHLRSASLGAGATPWQTATRIIIPTAMSGLFSAVMIGLGRAVGETMIVLMAAGNTSIMDWNVFNGFQTLSALIATELPEAVRNSTHYRTLFLAALTLFLLTFIVNTAAEVIRLRFRRRAYEL